MAQAPDHALPMTVAVFDLPETASATPDDHVAMPGADHGRGRSL